MLPPDLSALDPPRRLQVTWLLTELSQWRWNMDLARSAVRKSAFENACSAYARAYQLAESPLSRWYQREPIRALLITAIEYAYCIQRTGRSNSQLCANTLALVRDCDDPVVSPLVHSLSKLSDRQNIPVSQPIQRPYLATAR